MAIDRPNVFGSGAATNTDLFLDAATDKLGTASRVISFAGINSDIDASPEFITRSGTAISPSSGALYDGINSTSASDASAGIGVQQVLLEGIDSNGDLASEFVTMNGTSIVSLTNDYIWVNNVGVTRVGAGTTQVGSITLRDGFTGYQTGITADSGIPFMGGVGYPRGFVPVLKNLTIQVSQSAITSGNVLLSLYHAQGLNTTTPSVGVIRQFNVALGSVTAGAYNVFVETIRPPFLRPGNATDGFLNTPSAGVFYMQADGDAAVDAVVSFQCDLFFRDARN